MSVREVRIFVYETIEKTTLYQSLHLEKSDLIPFVAFSPVAFRNAIRQRLYTFLCGKDDGQIRSFSFDDPQMIDAIYVDIMKAPLSERNGREVDDAMLRIIDAPLESGYWPFCVEQAPQRPSRWHRP